MTGPFDANQWFQPDDEVLCQIATQLRCPQEDDTATVGDVVALGIEPGEPYGRIVDFTGEVGIRSVAVQKFKPGDTLQATGEIRTGALGMAWCPWILAPKYGAPDHAKLPSKPTTEEGQLARPDRSPPNEADSLGTSGEPV